MAAICPQETFPFMPAYTFHVTLETAELAELIGAGAEDAVADLLDLTLADELRAMHRDRATGPGSEEYPVRVEDVVRRAVRYTGDSIAGALSFQLALTEITRDPWADGLGVDGMTTHCEDAVRTLLERLPAGHVDRFLTE
jgi:hypothetical protein